MARNFQNLTRKRLLRLIYWNPPKMELLCVTWSDNNPHNTVEFIVCFTPNSSVTLPKVYTRRTSDELFFLQPCFLDVLPVGILINNGTKGFTPFDKYAARCVHLSPGKECTSSSWGDSKMYRSGSIANSQRMLTEINENGAMPLPK